MAKGRLLDFQQEKNRVIEARQQKLARARRARKAQGAERRAKVGRGIFMGVVRSLRWCTIVITGSLSTLMVKIDRIVLGFLGSIVFGLLLGLALYWFSDPREWDNIMRMGIGIAVCVGAYGVYLCLIFVLSLINTILQEQRDSSAADSECNT